MSGIKCTPGVPGREAAAGLAPADLARLEAVLDLALRPLEHPCTAEWGARVCRAAESLCGVAGAAASLVAAGPPGRAARLALSFPRGAEPAALRRWRALERLLAPAVRAGAAAWAHREARARSLALAVDASPAPTFLCAADGRVLHANPAAAGLPDIAEGTAPLREQVRALACRAAAPSRGADDPRGPHRPGSGWRLRATPLAPDTDGAELVMVTVEHGAPAALTDRELRERFRLTEREVEIARLLADGLSNAEIAARLHISPFTARNHVENTMGKLGVPRRSRVGPVLAGAEGRPAQPGRRRSVA